MQRDLDINLESILKEGLKASPDCFGVLSPEMVVVFCNDVFAEAYGLSKEEALGKTNKELLKHAWKNQKGLAIKTDDFEPWYQNVEKMQRELPINQFESDFTDGRWFKMTRIKLDCGYTILLGVNITDLKETQKSLEIANKKIEALANTDALTGVNNRRSFALIAEREIKRAKRYQQPLSLLIMDIDYFKQINDQFGHHYGDIVLHEFAQLCSALLRQTDCIFRIGGEEFAILLPMTDIPGAYKIAERIRSTVDAYDFYLNELQKHLTISVSIGISYLTNTEQSIKDILIQADSALYNAKKNGRNQVVVYSL